MPVKKLLSQYQKNSENQNDSDGKKLYELNKEAVIVITEMAKNILSKLSSEVTLTVYDEKAKKKEQKTTMKKEMSISLKNGHATLLCPLAFVQDEKNKKESEALIISFQKELSDISKVSFLVAEIKVEV